MDKNNILEVCYENDTKISINRNKLKVSVDKAIDFLLEEQLDYGEFKTEICYKYKNSSGEILEEWTFDSSPFITALVLYSTGFLEDDERVKRLKEYGLKFLITEMEEEGLWRYCSSKNENRFMLPPDLDDICCISHILKDNNVIFPENINIVLKNKNQQDIFYTWLFSTSKGKIYCSNNAWSINQENDVCCVVNANILLYLGETEQTQKVVEYLTQIILEGREKASTPFYNHKFSFYYMLSRAYFNGVSSLKLVEEAVIDRILYVQEPNGSFGNELLTSLAVCSLLNYGHYSPQLSKAITFLIKNQQADGSWKRVPMYGYHTDKATYGSAELTTAFCIEALARYWLLDSNLKKKEIERSAIQSFEEQRIDKEEKTLLLFFKAIRSHDWWLYKIPPLLAISYAEILLLDLPVLQSILTVAALLFAIACVAAYGHIINDSFDIEVDRQVGKRNAMAQFSPWQRALFCLALTVLGFSLPILMHFGTLAISLLGINYLLPTLYSAPPFRFKEKGILGILSDAAGAHAIPTLFIATTFAHLVAAPSLQVIGLAIAATAWSFFAGVRGILLHQLWDRDDDLRSGVKTLVTESAVETVRFWMSRVIFPIELLLLSALILVIAHSTPLILVFTIGYFLLKIILFKADPTATFDPAPTQKAYVVPHDFYEVGLPLILATALSLQNAWFATLLLLQVILFYPSIERRVTNLMQSLRGKPQDLNPIQVQLTVSQTELAQLNSRLQQTQNQLEQTQTQLQQLQTESQGDRAQTQTALATLQAELAQAESARQPLQAELGRFKAYLQHTQGTAGVMDYYRHAIATNPDDLQLYYQALEAQPDDAHIHLQLGNALVRQGQFAEAIARYQTALQHHPDNVELHLELGKTLEQAKQWDEAIAAYRRAIDLNPNYSLAHQHLGDALAERGQLHEASVSYRRVLQLQHGL